MVIKLPCGTLLCLLDCRHRRVSELLALGFKEHFMTLYVARVVLTPMLQLITKVASKFHMAQEIDLKSYIKATTANRKSDHLFVSPAGANRSIKQGHSLQDDEGLQIAGDGSSGKSDRALYKGCLSFMGSSLSNLPRNYMQGGLLFIHLYPTTV